MSKIDPKLYVDREQTLVKHVVLESYLEKLVYKVGRRGGTLNYIDGFAGPWQSKGQALQDTSPHIAARVLRSVREKLIQDGCPALDVRTLFIESDEERSRLLRDSFVCTEVPQVTVLCGAFEDHIEEAVAFSKAGQRPFHFSFIDPCGWTGLGLKAITPLLRAARGEVLVNFMTNQINRFIEDDQPKIAGQFEDLYGDPTFRKSLIALTGLDRQDRMVDEYCARVRQAGGFAHVVSSIVLNPHDNRVHFHLVYGTRHDEGLRTFRDIERSALGLQSKLRTALQHEERKRNEPGQGFLFAQPQELLAIPHVETLHERYLTRARRRLIELLVARDANRFDDLAVASMQYQTVSEKDTRDILMSMGKQIAIEGLEGKQRTPQWNKSHVVRTISKDLR